MKLKTYKKYLASYEMDENIRKNVWEAVWKENLRSTNFFLLTGAVGLVLCALSPLFYEKNIIKAVFFLVFAAVCFIVYLFARHVSGKKDCTERQANTVLWFAIVVMFAGQLYIGCLSAPTRMSTIYHAILLYTMALFVFKPKVAILGPIISTVCFLTIEIFVKDPALVLADSINSIFSTGMGIIVALYTSKVRIKGFISQCREVLQNEELRAAVESAYIANQAKSQFMSQMSHEIRTPLNAIIGYNTLSKNVLIEAKTDEERRQANMDAMDYLTKSELASRHLLSVINDVLDMSAIDSGKIQIAHERFDFKGLINSLTTIFYSQARTKGVEFEVVFDTMTEEWFIGDQMRTGQILTNILSNAVKFTQNGGKVKLSIRQELVDQNAHIHFIVSDTGIGMTSEYLSHIWTPFEQADSSISRRFGGTGLGLSITKNLVDLMGGNIEVESQLGVGSSFKIDLIFERTKQPSGTTTFDFSMINALVVDDDINTCNYIQFLMNRFGVRCHTVTSGYDAIEAVDVAQKKHEPYTICLVDWQMPMMDGLETIKRIREIAGNEIPIIVISAYDFSEIATKTAEVGVTKFISKPLFQSSLFDLLASLFGVQMERKNENIDVTDLLGIRLLLAEDNAMNMEIASRILESAGAIVDKAWNGQEAVTKFEASSVGTYNAILMDIQMPVMNGHIATQKIRASNHPEAKSIPIIAMTADAFSENVVEAMTSGMNGHIAKPINIETLFETLKSIIGIEKESN